MEVPHANQRLYPYHSTPSSWFHGTKFLLARRGHRPAAGIPRRGLSKTLRCTFPEVSKEPYEGEHPLTELYDLTSRIDYQTTLRLRQSPAYHFDVSLIVSTAIRIAGYKPTVVKL